MPVSEFSDILSIEILGQHTIADQNSHQPYKIRARQGNHLSAFSIPRGSQEEVWKDLPEGVCKATLIPTVGDMHALISIAAEK